MQIGALDYGQFYGILAKGMARAWELVDVNEGRNTFLVAIAVLKAACMSRMSEMLILKFDCTSRMIPDTHQCTSL
jgi:hypothetical protein